MCTTLDERTYWPFATLYQGTNPFMLMLAAVQHPAMLCPTQATTSRTERSQLQLFPYPPTCMERTQCPDSLQSPRCCGNEANDQYSQLHGTNPMPLLRTKTPSNTAGTNPFPSAQHQTRGTNPKITTSSLLCKGNEAMTTLTTLPLARNEAMRTQATLLYSRNEPMLTLTALPPSRNEANDRPYPSTPERTHFFR